MVCSRLVEVIIDNNMSKASTDGKDDDRVLWLWSRQTITSSNKERGSEINDRNDRNTTKYANASSIDLDTRLEP